jgi:hypothetical protein
MQSRRASTRQSNPMCETALPLWLMRLFDLQLSAYLFFCHVFSAFLSPIQDACGHRGNSGRIPKAIVSDAARSRQEAGSRTERKRLAELLDYPKALHLGEKRAIRRSAEDRSRFCWFFVEWQRELAVTV